MKTSPLIFLSYVRHAVKKMRIVRCETTEFTGRSSVVSDTERLQCANYNIMREASNVSILRCVVYNRPQRFVLFCCPFCRSLTVLITLLITCTTLRHVETRAPGADIRVHFIGKCEYYLPRSKNKTYPSSM